VKRSTTHTVLISAQICVPEIENLTVIGLQKMVLSHFSLPVGRGLTVGFPSRWNGSGPIA
jgi:hypothetical protein